MQFKIYVGVMIWTLVPKCLIGYVNKGGGSRMLLNGTISKYST